MGYTDRTITLEFPELGDDISVTIRNPLLLPPSLITPRDIPLNDNGEPLNRKDAEAATWEMFAGIITTWHVYDPLAADDVLLGEPSEQTVSRLPNAILARIAEELGKAVPQG